MVTYHLTQKKNLSWSFYFPTFSLSFSCFSPSIPLFLLLSLSRSPSTLLIFRAMADFILAMQITTLYARAPLD
jgi:hypothetical protein